ncbi:MAG: hypothetical protein RLZ92_1668 [Pseudomonadota bacterium]
MSSVIMRHHFSVRPLPVSHKRNLLWWLVLITVVWFAHQSPRLSVSAGNQNQSSLTGIENQAFLALVFGKVSHNSDLAISARGFEEDLMAIKQAGYHTLGLTQVERWRSANNPSLPSKPLLLSFEEANRETIEIVDPLLADLAMTATVFVDVEQLEQANIHLVSWHQLELMAKSGRWEIGISACPGGDDQGFADPAALAQKLTRQRQLLEQRLQISVLVADCSRAWNSQYGDGSIIWSQTLNEAGLSIGFVASVAAANYYDDPQTSFKRMRVSKNWTAEQLINQLNNYQPRHSELIDQFDLPPSESAWIVDNGELIIQPRNLQLTNTVGEQGGLISLAGSEKWRDADVEVQLNQLPEGQFWLSLRHRVNQPTIRLGVANGQVLLQESLANDVHKQLASIDVSESRLNLRLRVIGQRATAFLNGQPLLSRPVVMPEGANQGALTLAVWQPQFAQALVNINQISAKPIKAKTGLVSPLLDQNSWQQLRETADQLTTISPLYFAWQDNKLQQFARYDNALEIFARYHHLKFHPALVIDPHTPFSDTPLIAEQLSNWVNQAGFDGFNLVINDSMLDDGWRAFLIDLIQRIKQTGKTLIVTKQDAVQPQTPIRINNYLSVDTGSFFIH